MDKYVCVVCGWIYDEAEEGGASFAVGMLIGGGIVAGAVALGKLVKHKVIPAINKRRAKKAVEESSEIIETEGTDVEDVSETVEVVDEEKRTSKKTKK